MKKHTYPPNYPPGKDADMDTVWRGLDFIDPGVLSDEARFYLAGFMTGAIKEARRQERDIRDGAMASLQVETGQRDVER